ncbi:MAG: cobalt-precorrin 5A hydrolase [Ruminococcus sp.]|nr:cobalt-precorrin 5A hydrolase [Ruminococcus sp.]
MRTAVISFTENGRALSERIAENATFIDCARFCFHRHSDASAISFTDIIELVSDIFLRYDGLIFICACGIAVRSVAPHISSKTTDPAVVVIDDCGRFVIPVLSGHIGGANELAMRLAGLIGAQSVITTATDTGGHFSPDSFAKANDLIITDMTAAKAVASAVLDGERIGFVSDHAFINMPDDISPGTGTRTGICVGNGDTKPFPVTLRLVPRNVVLGIGCKRGTECDTIERAVAAALKTAGIEMERVCGIATIDLKKDEKGLLGFCKNHDLELDTFSADELMSADGEFSSSEFVRSVTGADNVCERSAVILSGGELVMHKTSSDGVTVAAAEKKLILDFERRRL